jgi:DNA modification methylase
MTDYRLYNGDCLPFMQSLGDGEVDFTFYDPPYNREKDYGVYKDSLPPDEYRRWMIEVAREVRRVSRRGFAVYVSSTLTRLFFEILPDAHLIPIHKRAVGAMMGGYFLQYHSLFVVGEPIIRCADLWDDIRLPGEGYYFREERFNHPGQTALALVRRVLHHFTVEGDVVFDPFLGVGTTAVAALSMGRRAVGCEVNPTYIATAERRIRSLLAQPEMFARRPVPRQQILFEG